MGCVDGLLAVVLEWELRVGKENDVEKGARTTGINKIAKKSEEKQGNCQRVRKCSLVRLTTLMGR